MNRFLMTVSMVAILGMATPVFAGPNVGRPVHGERTLKKMKANRQEMRKETAAKQKLSTGEIRWEKKHKWIGGHRERRVTHIRVPVE